MPGGLTYLSEADVRRLRLAPREAREAMLDAFRAIAAGTATGLPKNAINPGPGHLFQSMVAAWPEAGLASVKWVAVAPVSPGEDRPGVNGLICLSDYRTGVPVAVLDGNALTLLRTAALSAAAASLLAPAAPARLGLVGCGAQASSHLDAMADLFPTLREVLLLSRSRASAERLATQASALGLTPAILPDPGALLPQCDLVVSTVPNEPGLRPFLDARLLPSACFVAAVDAGWSWMPESLPAFARRATDSITQLPAPLDNRYQPVHAAAFQTVLAQLATAPPPPDGKQRTLFAFRGAAIADLAVAALALRCAREDGIGQALPR